MSWYNDMIGIYWNDISFIMFQQYDDTPWHPKSLPLQVMGNQLTELPNEAAVKTFQVLKYYRLSQLNVIDGLN